MFEAKTYDALLAEVLAAAPAGIDTRQGSIFYDAVSGILLQIAKMYADLDQIFELVFIITASGEYLDLRANEYGLSRKPAGKAVFSLTYTGTQPPVGARFFHGDTRLYFVVTADGEGNLYLTAEVAGTGPDEIEVGDPAVPVNTIDGLTAASFGAVYRGGSAEESDDDLRERIQNKISGPAENGNKQHYKLWCESRANVAMARITPLWNGPNTVKAVLIGNDGLGCDSDTVADVQEYVDPNDAGTTVTIDGKTYNVGDGLGEGVANLGAHFTAVAASNVLIAVSFTAELATGATVDDAKSEAATAITKYFKDLVLENDDPANIVIRVSAIGAVIAGLESVLDYSNLTLNGATSNISPDADEVPKLNGVTVNV